TRFSRDWSSDVCSSDLATKEQVKRLEEVGEMLGTEVTGHACEGMKGLIKEAQGLLDENEPGAALDVALISAAQRVEHYDIAGYEIGRASCRERRTVEGR